MSRNVYLLVTGYGELPVDTIYSRDTHLKIRVYNLSLTGFIPNDGEIQLYAYQNEDLLVFETVDITADDAMEMVAAIQWYSSYTDCPKMEILPEDPRLERGNEIAV